MKKHILPIAFALVVFGAEKAYSAQLTRQEIDNVVATALNRGQNHAEITPDFVRGVILTESAGNTNAQSRVGARGLMQIIRPTWNDITNVNYDTQAFDAQANVETGIRYLNQLAASASRSCPNWSNMNHEERQGIIAAAYNGGIGRLRQREWRINRMPEETRNYVPRVQRNSRR